MSKEFYLATMNLHIEEFGCTVAKGSLVEIEDGIITCGTLEGELSRKTNIFLKGGFLKKIDGKEAKKIQDSVKPNPPKKVVEEKKMKVVNGDKSKIDIPEVEKTDDERIIEEDGGIVVDGMKVREKETVDIVRKLDTKGDVKSKASEGEARNRKPEKKEVDKAEIKRRREERVKKAAEAEAAAKAEEAKTEEAPKTVKKTPMKVAAADESEKPEKVIKMEK